MLTSTLLLACLALAPFQDSRYLLPPPEVVKILDAAPTPSVDFSPDARWMLVVEQPAMPSIADVARPWEGLAGLRIDPTLMAQRRVSFARGLALRATAGGPERRLELPAEARIERWSWSPDSTHVAYTLAGAGGLELWVAAAAGGAPRKLATRLNGVLDAPFRWSENGRALLVRLVPDDAREPAPRTTPSGPAVQETSGSTTPLRTYQDLLVDADSEARFEHFARVALARIELATGTLTRLGPPALYSEASPSPDGSHLVVTRLQRPFSYVLPWSLFPQTIELWKKDGTKVRTLAEVPLGEHIPMEGVRTGPRSFGWQASAPAVLTWFEAQDGGDPAAKAEFRDRLVRLEAPFTGEPRELCKLEQRARGLQWLGDGGRYLVGEYDRDRRWLRTFLCELAGGAPKLVEDRSTNDRYGDPGAPVTIVGPLGTRIVPVEEECLYRAGMGHTPSGPRPFFDRVSLADGTRERLWQCAEGRFESFVGVARLGDARAILTSSESPIDPPNYQWRELTDGKVTALTSFPDPTPEIRGIKTELLTYARADGVQLSGTLYLPADHVPGTRLPLFVWAYPMEFSDAATAGQVSSSPHRFVRMRGATHLVFAAQGYAVLDGATMPVVGDPETMNDTFVEQIVAAAQAAIDACVAKGVADPERVLAGGHSYGAFMTANLLAHCDLFRTGIARSGAYNRTLTPFGFQSERRTLWESPESYVKLSPFFRAHEIDEPILLIHGEKDSNPGTFPLQSERLYQAVKGNGGTARLVFLPAEDHGYQARESVLHTVAEMLAWSDRHVKNAAPRARASEAAASGTPGAGSR